jgi:hypothetical protein
MQFLRKNQNSQLVTRYIPLFFLLFFLTGCITDLQVKRHPSVPMSNTTADDILNQFGLVIRVADTTNDFACASQYGTVDGVTYQPASYIREGNVGLYSGVAAINTQAEFFNIINQAGDVKVVGAINWCGEIIPNVLGCSPLGGSSIAVVGSIPASIKGIVWAHEYGHSVGLNHREASGAVMNSYLATNHKVITELECRSFVSRYTRYIAPATGAVSAAKEAAIPLESSKLVDGQLDVVTDVDMDVVSFVRQIYIHGTPMGIASSFENTDAVSTLLPMLKDDKEKPYWGNIAAVLGMIGDKTVAQPLIDFAEQEKNRGAGWENARQITATMMGLGYVANRTDDTIALDYLESASSPEHWSNKNKELQEQLSVGATIGLALSGRAEAWQVIALSAQAKGKNGKERNASLLDLHTLVSQKGLKEYYSRKKQ